MLTSLTTVFASNDAPAVAQAPGSGIRGDSAALAAVERLLEHVGGRPVWSRRTLEVEERGYLRSGEVVSLRIVRDFQQGVRRLERRSQAGTLIEWLSPEEGWVNRDGAVTRLGAVELAIELQGLRQEPYAVYHRIARRDSDLRVELRDQGALLMVYGRDERVLCWFQLDATGKTYGWGNVFDGIINQHYYGPLSAFGDASFPRWGVSANGSFRFEYLSARLLDTPIRAH